jgi:hypothetical protein
VRRRAALLAALVVATATAQEPPPAQRPEEQDLLHSPDGSFDISGFLSTRVGFLPIVVPITEPAVGYGLALGLSYFHSEPAQVDDAGAGRRTIMPSTSVLFGASTENGTWAAGFAHLGIWDQGRTRYVGAAGYANLELDWFGRDDALQGRSIAYTNDALFVFQNIKFQVADSCVFVGPQYKYLGSDATFDTSALDPGIPSAQFDSRTSGLGLLVGYDSLDHPYAPTRGIKAEVTGMRYGEWLGGDFEYTQLRSYAIGYLPLSPDWVLGLKGNVDCTFGTAPFYDLPFVSVRGIAKARFVDDNAVYGESELRWDFAPRWSMLGFAGGGSVGDTLGELGAWHFAGGTGARYLIAERYGLRMGLDVAYGDDEWTVYVGLGTGWVRP